MNPFTKFAQIKGKKQMLAKAMQTTGIFSLGQLLFRNQLVIFNFHRIRDDNDPVIFDDSLFGPNIQTVTKHMKWLKLNADAVSESDLLNHFKNGTKLPSRGFMITFDDGYLDNYTLGLPLFKELNIPAIYFVPTKVIQERGIGWWDIIYYMLKKTAKKEIYFRGERFEVPKPVMPLAEIFNSKMKLLTANENHLLLDELSHSTGVDLPPQELCSREMMSWDQIREVDKTCVKIGSHTHSHRVLATLDLETQRYELKHSKEILEKELGRKVHSFSYPVGGYEHFNTETKQFAREAGYELAFSFLTGINHNSHLDPMDLKRLSFQTDSTMYDGALSLPWLFGKRGCYLPKSLPYAELNKILSR